MIDVKFLSFLSLCETRNYTKTAELLFITQPSVTNHIKLIEKTYNIKLFTSKNKDFQLTPQGELLYKYVLQLKAMDAQFERLLSACGKQKFHVTMGVTKNINHSFLKYILGKWSTDNPNISYCLNVKEYDDILTDLTSGFIDLAIVDNKYSKRNFQVIPLISSKIIFGVNKKHPLAKIKQITFEQLQQERLILDIKGTGKRDFLDSQLKLHNRNIKDIVDLTEINCPYTTLNLVLNNPYVGLFYECEIEDEIKRGKIIPIEINGINGKVDFNLIYIKNHLSAKLIDDIAKEMTKIYFEINYLKYTSS